jgi:adenine-specific DNA-methyltransferase
MEKMRMESINLTEQNIEKIGAMFPNVITESKDENGKLKKAINFALLKQMLSDEVIEGDEAYEFTWVGKKAAIIEAGKPTRKTLRPCKEESKDWETTNNLYIEGDNLDVLKLLQEGYLDTIKMVYIDPPYNTGKDSFMYPDDFSVDYEEYIEQIELYDDDGNIRFKPNESGNPRFHSDWCSMMYPRLLLARNLLANDGVVFISIDEKEVTSLVKICDEVFGASNHLETFHIQVRYGNKSLNEDSDFQPVMEYILVYSKNKESFKPQKPSEPYDLSKFIYSFKELTEGETLTIGNKTVTIFKEGEWEINKNNQGRVGLLKETWASGSIVKQSGTAAEFLSKHLIDRKPKDGLSVLYKIHNMGEDGLGYRYVTGPAKEDAIRGKFYTGVPLQRIDEMEQGTSLKYRPIVNFYDYSGDFGNIRKEGGIAFNSGKKPVKLIDHLLFTANLKPNDIVLDFFSGSASTAQAVMQYNMINQTNVKFILVQIDENLDEKDDLYRDGYRSICDIGKKRISNVREIINNGRRLDTQSIDLGFRVMKLDNTNMKDVYYAADDYSQGMLSGLESNIKEDRSDLDLLFGCLIEWGLPLSLPHSSEEVNGILVHTINDGDLIACFAQNISEVVVKEIAKRQPLRAVFRDGSFANSPQKINVEEIFKLMAPNTSVKVL